MKKVHFIFLLISSTFTAQTVDVYDIIAKETCSCIESKKIEINALTNENQLNMALGLCMLESYNKHLNELPENERNNLGDDAKMEDMGKKIGIKMVTHCPDILMAIGQMEDDEESSKSKQQIIEGKVIGIETKQFVTIKLKDKNNRVHNFLLLQYFDTASVYTDEKIKPGTELIVGYTEVEMYDPEAKDFKYFKIITSLQKK
jgi:hypothetical protein